MLSSIARESFRKVQRVHGKGPVMRAPLILVVSAGPLALLAGCSTAVNLVTLPVRLATGAVSAGVDAVTTSQSERDRAEGRRLRQEDERRGREARQQARQQARDQARDRGRSDPPEIGRR